MAITTIAMATNVAPDMSQRNCSVPSSRDVQFPEMIGILIFEAGPEICGVTGQSDGARGDR